jgi:tRNA A37 threonylcarbamoyltransferase TsaD
VYRGVSLRDVSSRVLERGEYCSLAISARYSPDTAGILFVFIIAHELAVAHEFPIIGCNHRVAITASITPRLLRNVNVLLR